MTNYTIHDEVNAPDDAKEALTAVKANMGFIPNTLGIMAAAPSTLKAYLTLLELVADTSLTTQEQRAMVLAISAENGCEYCIAAEGMLAHKTANIARADVDAIVEKNKSSDPRLDAIGIFARTVVSTRGRPSEQATTDFLGAGFTQQNILEVVLGAAIKTLTNYSNTIAHTPIDDVFADYAPCATCVA